MRSECAHLVAGNSATVLYFVDNLFHAVDGGPGKGVAIELHVQFAFTGFADRDGFCILRSAAEEKFAKPVGKCLCIARLA